MISIPWKQTRKHQTNQSSSKSAFPFPKDKRFKHKDLALCGQFYNIPSTLGRGPASGIGKGNKIQIVNQTINNPSPSQYQIKQDFSLTKQSVKFALGRQNIKYNGIFLKSETPQPGHYEISQSLSTKRGFSIYKKLQPQQMSYERNPGPSHYKSIQAFNNTGKYVLSQLTNCPGYKIKNTKQKKSLNFTPGPGQYETNTENMNANGRYNNSKHQNSRCRTFSRSMKQISVKKQAPGPGTYNYYSQFGRRY